MEICKKTIFLIIVIFFTNCSYAKTNFDSFEKKSVTFLDFFLLKIENRLTQRAQMLGEQSIATRVQYQSVGVGVDYIRDKDEILIDIKAIMDKIIYQKKKYKQKLSDCNTVRNLIFYKKVGYSLFTQKRISTYLSQDYMVKTFKEVFLKNLTLKEEEKLFLLNHIYVRVNLINPVDKTQLVCRGKVNQYELQ